MVKYENLNEPSPADTPNIWLHMGQFCTKETKKLAEQLLHIRQMRKNMHQNRQKRLRQSHHEPHSQQSSP